jgi:hypothetical protein
VVADALGMDVKIRFVALLLAALPLAAGTAYAAAPAPAGSATASAAEEEFEVIEEVEEEDRAEECAEAEVEFELGEIEAEEMEAFCKEAEVEAGSAGSSSAQCPLRSAHAHAATNHRKLKVTLGYTAYKPFQAKLHLSSHLGNLKRHLSRSGVLRFTRQLGKRKPHKLVLKLRPVGATGCPSRRLVLFSG